MPVEKPEKSVSSAEQTWFNVPDMDASFLLTDVSVAKADIIAAPAEHELPSLDAALQDIAVETSPLDAQHLEEAEMVWEQVQVPEVHQAQEAEEEIQIGNDIRIRAHAHPPAEEPLNAPKTWVQALQLLDTQGALRRLGENQDLYKLLLEDFVNASYDFPQQMSIALDAEQMNLATRLAHTLKGTAATIGAEQVRTLAAEIETQLRRENQTDRHLCTQLYHQLEEVLHQLDEVLGLAAPEPLIDAEDDKVTDRLESSLYQPTQAHVGIEIPDNPQQLTEVEWHWLISLLHWLLPMLVHQPHHLKQHTYWQWVCRMFSQTEVEAYLDQLPQQLAQMTTSEQRQRWILTSWQAWPLPPALDLDYWLEEA